MWASLRASGAARLGTTTTAVDSMMFDVERSTRCEHECHAQKPGTVRGGVSTDSRQT